MRTPRRLMEDALLLEQQVEVGVICRLRRRSGAVPSGGPHLDYEPASADSAAQRLSDDRVGGQSYADSLGKPGAWKSSA